MCMPISNITRYVTDLFLDGGFERPHLFGYRLAKNALIGVVSGSVQYQRLKSKSCNFRRFYSCPNTSIRVVQMHANA